MTSVNGQIRKICYTAFLAALSVVLTRFASYNFGFIRLGIGSIPIILSSLICGPIYGCLTGFIADISGAMIFPSGPYFYGYTIDAALQGVLPFLVMKLFKGRYKTQAIYASTLIGGILAFVIAFVTLFDKYSSKSLNLSFEIQLWAKILIPLLVVFYFLVVYSLLYFVLRTKKIHISSREEKSFSFFDVYLISLTNELLISMCLLGVWNNLFFGIDYVINSFTQLLIFSVNGILRSLIIYSIMLPLCKIDKNIPSLTKDK